jgi:hypothetical protein
MSKSSTKTITLKIGKKKQGGGKGSRKIGRNLNRCARYRAALTREKNKARKARKEAKLRAKKAAKKLARKARGKP